MAGGQTAVATGPADQKNGSSSYETFLASEYQQIAAAHFNAVETLSTFFKHYLVIAALPLSVFGLMYSNKLSDSGVNELKRATPFVFFAVSFIGTFVLCYMSSLWFDQVLYARVVNGLRSYFTRRSGLSFSELSVTRVLPISINQPPYSGKGYFFWVVIAVAGINAAYMALGAFLLSKWPNSYTGPLLDNVIQAFYQFAPGWPLFPVFCLVAGAIVFLINIDFHDRRAKDREANYLKSPVIGIDLDGVLNRHREQFAEILRKQTQKDIKPDQITKIPVRKCEGLGVTAKDEAFVFNDPEYWINMPVDESAQRGLKEIESVFGRAKLRIYTRRDWPDYKLILDKRKEFHKLWKPHWYQRSMSIDNITQEWLNRFGFPTKEVIIEKSEGIRARFQDADAGSIRVFIEDDLSNARRLAMSCEKVLLLDAPYNRDDGNQLPPNVIRVKSWDNVIDELLLPSRIPDRPGTLESGKPELTVLLPPKSESGATGKT